jgi:hypothetical protein
VLMAHAQRLQEQVKTLTAECNDLRAQLIAAGIKHEPRLSSTTPQTGLGEGSGMRMDHDHHDQGHHSDNLGSLSIGVNGQSKYHGESAGSEVCRLLLVPKPLSHAFFPVSAGSSSRKDSSSSFGTSWFTTFLAGP